MAVAITIRNVPEKTRDELAARAARSGQSLQEYLRKQLIEAAARATVDDWVSQVRRRVETVGSPIPPTAILDALDDDRR